MKKQHFHVHFSKKEMEKEIKKIIIYDSKYNVYVLNFFIHMNNSELLNMKIYSEVMYLYKAKKK